MFDVEEVETTEYRFTLSCKEFADLKWFIESAVPYVKLKEKEKFLHLKECYYESFLD